MPSGLLTRDTSNSTMAQIGEVIIPFFCTLDATSGFDLWNEYWYFESAPSNVGSAKEEAVIIIPADSIAASGYSIAINPDGPSSVIKHDTPVIGKRRWIDSDGNTRYDVVWAGFVESIAHIGGKQHDGVYADHMRVKCVSAKKLLNDCSLLGHFAWDGTQVVFRHGIPLPINPRGLPNWTRTNVFNGLYLPAVSPDWGLKEDFVPDFNSVSSDNVTYCTLYMLIQYARLCLGPDIPSALETANSNAKEFFMGLRRLPSSFPFNFIWPDSFGANLDMEFTGNFDDAVGQNNSNQGGARKGREIPVSQGLALAGDGRQVQGLFDILFDSSGGYTWGLEISPTQPELTSPINITLRSLPARPQALINSFPIYYPNRVAQSTIKTPVVTSFELETSTAGVITRAVGIGARVQVEQRIASTVGGVGTTRNNALTRTWTELKFDEFRCACVKNDALDTDTIKDALKLYPNMFADWSFNPNYNPAIDTEFETYPIAIAPHPVWPYLLSYFGPNADNEAQTPLDYIPYPVRIECDDVANSEWSIMPVEQDGLVIWEFGRVHFEIFRTIGIETGDTKRLGAFYFPNPGLQFQTESVPSQGPNAKGWAIRQNDIRVTFAVGIDAALQYGAKTVFDDQINLDENQYELAPDSPDALRFYSKFSRTAIIDLSTLYELWLRVDSFPIPESAGGTQFPDKLTADDALRNNWKLLRQHVLKYLHDRNRAARSGYFEIDGFLCQNYPIGTQIKDIRKLDNTKIFALDCVVSGRDFLTNKNAQDNWASRTRYHIG